VRAGGQGQRHGGELLNEQDADAAGRDRVDHRDQLVDDHRGQAE
jgi:hypothetical protein